MEFKPNGQSGEFNHLINKRRIKVANESMVAFETGLREHRPVKGKQYSNKGLPKEKFDCIPAVERKEFPQFILTKKDFEARKKNLPHIGEGLFHELTGLTGRPEVVYSAQYPPADAETAGRTSPRTRQLRSPTSTTSSRSSRASTSTRSRSSSGQATSESASSARTTKSEPSSTKSSST